jgi:hypothetical protein
MIREKRRDTKSLYYSVIPIILFLMVILFCYLVNKVYSNEKMFNGQQIVVMKGWEGFADRLQVLSHCLHYCRLHKASICIDWRDYMWGQETLDFSDYFEIVGVNVVSIADVIERMKQGTTILPSQWNLEKISSVPNESTRGEEYDCPFNNSYKRVNSEIIVSNTKGFRTWHINNLTSNIRLKENIATIIASRLKKLEIPFTVIHLRGTDRLSNLTLEESIKPAVDIIKLQPEYITERMYVLSDMKEMINLWMSKFPKTKKLYNDYEIYKLPTNLNSGTHQIPKDVMEFYGLKKHNMNIDTIYDFLIISSAKWCFGNSKDSTYTNMASFIRKGGNSGVSKWLRDFYP